MRLHLIMIVATCVSLCTACKDHSHDDRLSPREELDELIDMVPGTVGTRSLNPFRQHLEMGILLL